MTTQNNHNSRLALISHLTLAGAAALAGGGANAQVTVVPVNETVGFGTGEVTSFTSSLPGVSQFYIEGIHSTRTFTSIGSTIVGFHQIFIGKAAGKWTVATSGTGNFVDYLNTPIGKKFSTLHIPKYFGGNLLGSTFSRQTTNHFGLLPPPLFVSFRFAPTSSGSFDYGWLELSAFGFGYPYVTIEAYAYDSSGAQLPNGQTTSTSSVPEPPATVALAALSALVLGATGIRRLRALQAEN